MSDRQKMIVYGVPFGVAVIALMATGHVVAAVVLLFVAGWMGW